MEAFKVAIYMFPLAVALGMVGLEAASSVVGIVGILLAVISAF